MGKTIICKKIMGKDIVFRTRKFLDNRLLSRKQCVVDVFHGTDGCPSKADVTSTVAGKLRTQPENVVLFGFKTKFGGGKTSGFCMIYDSIDALKKFEPVYRLRRLSLAPERATDKTRKIKKEIKIKRKKLRGTEKAKAAAGKQK